MEPLADADLGLWRDLKGVIFDVDDTLTTRGSLTAEAYGALWRLREAGLALAAVTGRPLGWADAMASMWPVDVAVGENGAGWSFARDGALGVGYFERDPRAREAQRQLLSRIEAQVGSELPEVRLAADQGARRCDLAFDVAERERLDKERLDALVGLIEAGGARALVSSVHAHAVPGGWDKAKGVAAALREVLGSDVAAERGRWLFVGDSGNDADAFAFFELTVGVANVRDALGRLPVRPRWVTEAERGAGFAELASRVIEGRG